MRFALLLVVLMPAVAHAGVDEKGVRVGTVFTGLSFEDDAGMGVKPELGLALASFVTLRLATSFAIQLEGQLQRQAFHSKMNDTILENFRVWAFELPALARLDLLPGDRKLYFVAGPAIVLSGGGETTSEADSTTTQIDGLKPLNFAIEGGIGLELPAGPGRITLDARYRRLLFPFTNGDNSISPAKPTEPHMIMGFVGYAFP